MKCKRKIEVLKQLLIQRGATLPREKVAKRQRSADLQLKANPSFPMGNIP
jgi:hypothetical protein